MESKQLLPILGLILTVFVIQAVSLQCHDCWTKDDDSCVNWDSLTDDTLWECGPKENVCKKIVTKYYRIVKRGLQADETLVSNITSRLCGTADWRGCRNLHGASSTTRECVCDTDRCNGAEGHLSGIPGITLMAVLFCSYLILRR